MEKATHLTGAQIRAARALLKWRVTDLAKASLVSPASIGRAEADQEMGSLVSVALRSALEAGGVEFITGGARLRQAVQRVNLMSDVMIIGAGGGAPGSQLGIIGAGGGAPGSQLGVSEGGNGPRFIILEKGDKGM